MLWIVVLAGLELAVESWSQVEGTPDRPRLCVFRSNKHLYVQVIDDTKMHTLASASTMQKPFAQDFDYSSGPTIVSLPTLQSFFDVFFSFPMSITAT
jgi:hypothetical protein